jgi:hypothetical protein
MVHCLDARSTISPQYRPFPSHLSTQLVKSGHQPMPRILKNQMTLNFKWLIQPFFALGEFGDFQYTDCCIISRSYVNIQVLSQVITDFSKSSSLQVHCNRSEQISFLRYFYLADSIFGTITAYFFTFNSFVKINTAPQTHESDSSDRPKLEDTTNPMTHSDWRLYVQN